ncbi:MAG: nucleotidyltransferase family protein [Clostridia bacterium]|nr:nucleotidyltransferase family protein [Clostridia bacterium]
MRIGFIVAEYNPLHNGHIKHIQMTKKELSCDAIVCIMSGDFVQRGEVAIADKYTRARWAIEAGADMVVELPVEFALGSAQVFADGAAKVIDYFDCEKYISFGSECGSEYVLEKIVEIMDSEEFQSYLHDAIQGGNSYAQSQKDALVKYLDAHNIDKSIASILDGSNNILGIEYIKAIKYMAISPFTIKRDGDYNSSEDNENPSATQIRKALYSGESIDAKVPPFVSEELIDVKDNKDKLFALIKYEFAKKNNLDKIFGMNEGLNNRFLNYLQKCNSYNEFIEQVKTKRYSESTLSRALINALIDNTFTFKDVIDHFPDYLNILAIRDSKKDLLSIIEADLVTKPAELAKLEKDKHVNSTLDKKASHLFKSLSYEYDNYMQIINI